MYPGSSVAEKWGERLKDLITDVLCVVLCVVLIIDLLPTQSVLSVISGNRGVVGVLDVTETTNGHWKAVSLLS